MLTPLQVMAYSIIQQPGATCIPQAPGSETLKVLIGLVYYSNSKQVIVVTLGVP